MLKESKIMMISKKLKTILAVAICPIIFAVSIFSFYPIAFADVKASGSFKNINWVLDETGTLTVNGTGEITNDINIKPYISEIKHIIINPGITAIAGSRTFALGSNIESVVLPEGFTTIGYFAFWGCEKLSKINLPESLTVIDASAFLGCTSLTHISLPKNLKTIGYEAFRSSGLEEITIPSGVSIIDSGMFWNCKNLKKVVLPDTIETIEAAAFDSCSALEEIILPPNIKSINQLVFRGCTSLKSLVFPDGIEIIDVHAIDNCTSLTEITIPSSVKTIGFRNFETCTSLIEINYFGTEEQWKNIDIDISETYSEFNFDSIKINYITFNNSEKTKHFNGDIIKNDTVTAAELLSHTESTALIKSKEGKTLTGDEPVGTGMTVLMSCGKEFEIICPGDIDGNGSVTAADARLALRTSVGLENYDKNSAYYKAADVNGQGITSSDARLILRASVGLENTLEWMR